MFYAFRFYNLLKIKFKEKETVNSSVFLSYQWDSQEVVLKIKENLEKAGFKCKFKIYCLVNL